MISKRITHLVFRIRDWIWNTHHGYNERHVSIQSEQDGRHRELALPEEVDFAVCGDEVLEEDEYWEGAAVSIVPCM